MRNPFFIFALLLCLAPLSAGAGRARNATQWGGPDFPFSCDQVVAYRSQINGMSRGRRAALARQFGITRKQRRQAEACLRERN